MFSLFNTTEPAWLTKARHLLGTQETPGPDNTPEILDWAKQEGGWIERFYTADAIPWCGLFVGHCLLEAGISGPKNPLSALSWGDWGRDLQPDCCELGAVLVFTRQGGGHVGFYVGEDEDGSALHVLGGNQADAVSITRISRERLASVRWPLMIDCPGTGPLKRPLRLSLSANEA
jgi:uncharacterized protein (TIGR02594 family)